MRRSAALLTCSWLFFSWDFHTGIQTVMEDLLPEHIFNYVLQKLNEQLVLLLQKLLTLIFTSKCRLKAYDKTCHLTVWRKSSASTETHICFHYKTKCRWASALINEATCSATENVLPFDSAYGMPWANTKVWAEVHN